MYIHQTRAQKKKANHVHLLEKAKVKGGKQNFRILLE
jgi:hypothetical protein